MVKQRKTKAQRYAERRRLAVVAAVLVTVALVFVGLIFAQPAGAETRADAVKEREESEKRIASLKGEMEGIDTELTSLAIQVEQSKIDLIDLQGQLAVAEQQLADAERKHQQLVDQLADAVTLKEEIDKSIEDSQVQEEELQTAVGNLAREMYRGDSLSPIQVIVDSNDIGEVTDRAAAATALGRVQSKAMDEVRTGLVVAENQAEKQQAVTERITDLEAKAKQAAIEAEQARDTVATNLSSVETKLAEQQSLQSQFETRMSTAKTELSGAQDDRADAIARIVAIDKAAAEKAAAEQAAREKAAAERAAAEEAARKANQNNQGGGSSGGSTNNGGSSNGGGSSGGSSNNGGSSSGAMFAYPFKFSTYISSRYGYRLHPIYGDWRLHDGTDFAAGCGTTQYATRSGTVADTGYNWYAGNYVTINHGLVNGTSYITEHYHLSAIFAYPGQWVDTNTAIGLTGTTGSSTGCHLHLKLYVDGSTTDITNYM